MGVCGTLNLHFDAKKWIFFELIFSTLSDQNSINIRPIGMFFHQLFKYVKKDANFSSINEKIAETILAHIYQDRL